MTDDEYWASIMANERAQIAKLTAECNALQVALHTERERCALIASSFGDFPGSPLIKDLHVMCGNAIADKIRETGRENAERYARSLSETPAAAASPPENTDG